MKSFETRAIHTPKLKTTIESNAISTPIFQTTSFEFEKLESLGDIIDGDEKGFGYSRAGNPTVEALELTAAQLEGGESCVAFGAGVAAIYATVLSICRPGDHIVAQKALYGGSHAIFSKLLTQLNIETSYVLDYNNMEAWREAMRPNTRMVFAETMGNPTLIIPDLGAITQVAHAHDAKMVVDATFTTPYLRRPLADGVDIVIHSATKYMGGHGDLIAGLTIGGQELMNAVRTQQILTGSIMSPFVAWLVLRGLKTLGLRMARHSTSGLSVAQFLEGHPLVKRVFYPGLSSHPDHARTLQTLPLGQGGVLSFVAHDSKEQALALVNRTGLFKRAGSLGDAHSLITMPALISHRHISDEELRESGIPPELIRLSIGLESPEDLIEDLRNALKSAH